MHEFNDKVLVLLCIVAIVNPATPIKFKILFSAAAGLVCIYYYKR